MPRSFFSAIRGPDGRSLSRALAFLVFVNALIAGLHGGMLAEAATGRTFITCTLAGAGHLPVGPVRDGERACCVLGCASSLAPTAVPEPPAIVDARPDLPRQVLLPVPDSRVAPFRIEVPIGPRGPPLLA